MPALQAIRTVPVFAARHGHRTGLALLLSLAPTCGAQAEARDPVAISPEQCGARRLEPGAGGGLTICSVHDDAMDADFTAPDTPSCRSAAPGSPHTGKCRDDRLLPSRTQQARIGH